MILLMYYKPYKSVCIKFSRVVVLFVGMKKEEENKRHVTKN